MNILIHRVKSPVNVLTGRVGERVTVNELQYLYPCIRFEVLTAMMVKITIVQDVMPCTSIETIFTRILNEKFSPVHCLKCGLGGCPIMKN
jgi:hypothetical protein